MELGKEKALVAFSNNQLLYYRLLIRKIFMKWQHSSHVVCFHSFRIDATFF